MTDLASENRLLRARLAELEEQLAFLSNHRTVSAGMAGETLVSRLVGGTVSAYAAGYDVMNGAGLRIEVKRSRTCTPTKGHDSARWQWAKVFGESGSKSYEFLLLVGEVDKRYRSLYKDPGSPFVFFVVPFESAYGLTTPGTRGTRKIFLGTNPAGLRSPASRRLFDEFEVTAAELTSRFGI